MECLRCGEAVSVPEGYERGADLVDEFQSGRESVSGELGEGHGGFVQVGQGGGQGRVKAVSAGVSSSSSPTAGGGASGRG